jgi:hypothetical protein
MNPDTGPYLKAAVICSDVIEGKDGALSLIRVIDRLTVTAVGSGPSAEMPASKYPLCVVIMFISGRAKGSKDVVLRVERPDASTYDAWSGTLFLEGEDRGANLVIRAEIEFGLQGLYWFDVYFEGARITRMPFRVIYQRAGTGLASP